jgi:hypothetical protein
MFREIFNLKFKVNISIIDEENYARIYFFDHDFVIQQTEM